MWWHTFLRTWNGTSMMQPAGPTLIMVSVASGSWGCGAAHGDYWFQLQWPDSWATEIVPKELVPFVVAAVLRGPFWAGRHVACLCRGCSSKQGGHQRSNLVPSPENIYICSSSARPTLQQLAISLAFRMLQQMFYPITRYRPFLSQSTGSSSASHHPRRTQRTGTYGSDISLRAISRQIALLQNCVASCFQLLAPNYVTSTVHPFQMGPLPNIAATNHLHIGIALLQNAQCSHIITAPIDHTHRVLASAGRR